MSHILLELSFLLLLPAFFFFYISHVQNVWLKMKGRRRREKKKVSGGKMDKFYALLGSHTG